MQWAAHRSHP